MQRSRHVAYHSMGQRADPRSDELEGERIVRDEHAYLELCQSVGERRRWGGRRARRVCVARARAKKDASWQEGALVSVTNSSSVQPERSPPGSESGGRGVPPKSLVRSGTPTKSAVRAHIDAHSRLSSWLSQWGAAGKRLRYTVHIQALLIIDARITACMRVLLTTSFVPLPG